VCQLPGCNTTQKDVESALVEYLDGFCVKCEKKRDGSLCGCPFPCSLTFKGPMLEKIHELIGKEIPDGVKSIQVCFKHPELLKLAREASIREAAAIRKDTLPLPSSAEPDRKPTALKTVKINAADCSVVNLSTSLLADPKIPDEFSIFPTVSDHREFLQPVVGNLEPSRDVSDNVTGIVYTDEGGEEQSLLGKLVYTTDETGSSNIILQEMSGEDGVVGGLGKTGRLMKIQLADMPFVIDPADIDAGGGDLVGAELGPDLTSNMQLGLKPRVEEVDSIDMKPESTAGLSLKTAEEGPAFNITQRETELATKKSREEEERKNRIRIKDLLEPATNTISLQHGLNKRKYSSPMKPLAQPRTITIARKSVSVKSWSPNLDVEVDTLDTSGAGAGSSGAGAGLQPLPMARKLEDSNNDVLVEMMEQEEEEEEEPLTVSQDKDAVVSSFKIQYREFEEKLITSQLPGLLGKVDLCDVRFVCADGEVYSSGIVLASISTFLKNLLDSLPRIDAFRTIMLPEFTVANLTLLNRIVFEDILDDLELEDLDNLFTVAQSLQCNQIASFCESRIISLTTELELPPSPPAPGHQDLDHAIVIMNEQVVEEGDMKPILPKKKKLKGVDQPLAALKIDKAQLNSDYMDGNGIVRLASRDEMAIHYCIICDQKFKKYKQAITHYKNMHMLEALLSCDVCDQLFKDMYTCVKHKHEKHGDFERNLQCYICQEVFYSRFRLNSHIKESHNEVYGEFVCKLCGTKFPALHYLSTHHKEDHNQSANSCNICGKSFSGKRYLTMHVKSSHQLGGKFDFQCRHCFLTFSHKKDTIYHCVKAHKEPKPPGVFEDCSFCDKFFKTRSELKQHLTRKHKQALS